MNKKKLVLLVCFALWGLGVLYFYNQYENGPVRRYKIEDGKAVVDPVTGEAVRKSFFEQKTNHLFLLTVACGIPVYIVFTNKKG